MIRPLEVAIEPAEEATVMLQLARPAGAFNKVAHSAGVRMSATITDSAIAETMVIENCR